MVFSGGVRVTAGVLIVGLATRAFGDPVTITTVFSDDFQTNTLSANPGIPVIGEPWQVLESSPIGIQVVDDPRDPLGLDRFLRFGGFRNTALAPFSPDGREQVAAAQDMTVRFEYSPFPGGSRWHHFDIASYDALTGQPAWWIRIGGAEVQELGTAFEVHYLHPEGVFIDTGLDVAAEGWQTIAIAADFAAETVDLRVGENAVWELPLFACPSEVVGVEFGSYGLALGSGDINNLSVYTGQLEASEESPAATPEVATGVLLLMGGLTLAGAWLLRRKAG